MESNFSLQIRYLKLGSATQRPLHKDDQLSCKQLATTWVYQRKALLDLVTESTTSVQAAPGSLSTPPASPPPQVDSTTTASVNQVRKTGISTSRSKDRQGPH